MLNILKLLAGFLSVKLGSLQSELKFTSLCSYVAHQVQLGLTNVELRVAPEVQSHKHLKFFLISNRNLSPHGDSFYEVLSNTHYNRKTAPPPVEPHLLTEQDYFSNSSRRSLDKHLSFYSQICPLVSEKKIFKELIIGKRLLILTEKIWF